MKEDRDFKEIFNKLKRSRNQMKTIKTDYNNPIPNNFTGIAEYSFGRKEWYQEGKKHRIDGPAVECFDGTKYWFIEGKFYLLEKLSEIINSSFYLGKEKGRYNLEWLKFLTEEKILEFPIISGMKEYKDFKEIFETLEEMENNCKL
jgi:hypothetical protein